MTIDCPNCGTSCRLGASKAQYFAEQLNPRCDLDPELERFGNKVIRDWLIVILALSFVVGVPTILVWKFSPVNLLLFLGNLGLAIVWTVIFCLGSLLIWGILLLMQPEGRWYYRDSKGSFTIPGERASATDVIWSRKGWTLDGLTMLVILTSLLFHLALSQFATFKFQQWYFLFWKAWPF